MNEIGMNLYSLGLYFTVDEHNDSELNHEELNISYSASSFWDKDPNQGSKYEAL